MKFKTKSKEKLFELLKKTVEERKVYLRGPNSKTLTLPSSYCKILGINLNDKVLVNVIEHNGIKGIFVYTSQKKA